MKEVRATARIVADVPVETKEKLQAILGEANTTTVQFIKTAIDNEYKKKFEGGTVND